MRELEIKVIELIGYSLCFSTTLPEHGAYLKRVYRGGKPYSPPDPFNTYTGMGWLLEEMRRLNYRVNIRLHNSGDYYTCGFKPKNSYNYPIFTGDSLPELVFKAVYITLKGGE